MRGAAMLKWALLPMAYTVFFVFLVAQGHLTLSPRGPNASVEGTRKLESRAAGTKNNSAPTFPPGAGSSSGGFGPITVLPQAPDSKGIPAAYARFVQLGNGRIILTFQGQDFPIFESLDYGLTWTNITVVKHKVGLLFEPYLFQLPDDFGDLAKGTILLAGNVISDNGTEIFIYSSKDLGHSWRYLSSVAYGGNPFSNKKGDIRENAHPIWEPALLLYEGKLICYYSDERDEAHSQKLSHQESKDGIHWGEVIDDIAMPTFKERPGMTNLALMNDGNWILVYEFGVANGTAFNTNFKKARDPLDFQAVAGHPLLADDGTQPGASPYAAWTPYGGVNGTLVVSAASTGSLFLNHAHGDGKWTIYPTKSHTGYSPAIAIAEWAENIVLIATGAPYKGPFTGVTFTAVELPPVVE